MNNAPFKPACGGWGRYPIPLPADVVDALEKRDYCDLTRTKVEVLKPVDPSDQREALMRVFFTPLLKKMRTDVHAEKGENGPVCMKKPLDKAMMLRHLDGGPGVGAYPMLPGERTTMVSLFDLDSHKGEATWEEMVEVGKRLYAECIKRGLFPMLFRSSGGRGIHFLFQWAIAQDAYSVRHLMWDMLEAIEFTDGCKGVKAGQIEVFPKQDSIGADGFGNMFILPLCGLSVPLDENFELMNREALLWTEVPDCLPVTHRERPVPAYPTPPEDVDLVELREAVMAIPNDADADVDYDKWWRIGAGIHHVTGGSAAGLQLFTEWSEQSPRHNGYWLERRTWPYIKDDKANPITAASIFAEARKHGWVHPEGGTGRNRTLTSEAGRLRAKGYDQEQIEEVLKDINSARFAKPLKIAEVEGIARSVGDNYARGFPLTDYGNAERLVNSFGARLRYCLEAQRWLFWDGTRWVWDESDAVLRCAKHAVRALYAEAALETDSERRSRLGKWAASSEAASRLHAMVDLAKSEHAMLVSIGQLDADPWALGLRSGVLNLRNGELLKADPERYLTKQAPVVFDAEASCPLWESFLDRIMGGDAEMIGYLQRAVGYTLSGDTMEKVLFFCQGGGDNGKSVFLDTLGRLVGDYFRKTPAETFMQRKDPNSSAPSPERVALRGARLVVASELSDGQRFNDVFIKDVTGGVDRISTRDLYSRQMEFYPVFKLWLYGNHKPIVRGDDRAIWRRIHLVPFDVQIPANEQDMRLPLKLLAELPGILNWALRGCLEWQRHGLQPPPKVLAATSQYREEMDKVGAFIKECCIEGDDKEAALVDLYREYREWCEQNGLRAESKPRLQGYLEQRGLKARNAAGNVLKYSGIGLRS